MKALPLLSLLAPLLLSACLHRADSLSPVVAITNPTSGTVRSAADLMISGYALDDAGISAIRVNGQNLLASNVYKGERGKKLVQFQFIPSKVDQGQWAAKIKVEDTAGRTTTLPYTLQIDTTKPTLKLSALESVDSTHVRVAGEASDNIMLKSVTVDGTELLYAPVKDKAFSLTVAKKRTITVTAEDQAGNKTTQTLHP
jgi:hypothetical protein